MGELKSLLSLLFAGLLLYKQRERKKEGGKGGEGEGEGGKKEN